MFAGYHTALVALGRYKEASTFVDSIYMYSEKYRITENSKQLGELVVKYELEKKEAVNLTLQKEKKLVENLNKIYIIGGLFTLSGFLLVGFLALSLNKSNTRLNSAMEEIGQLNKTREHFYSIIAHDLRRPMHAYQGMADLVNYFLKTKQYESIEQLSKSIDDSGRRIQQMLDNLLAWALSQREEIPYNPVDVNLLSKIQFIVNFYEKTLVRDSILFKIKCHPELLTFMDPNAIELILRNLLDNAIKSVPTTGGLISMEAYSNQASAITLVISDNGTSIDSTTLTEIRKVFTNPTNTHPGQYGLGLGFILVARFLQRNKCTIEIESSKGIGTSLIITMPRL